MGDPLGTTTMGNTVMEYAPPLLRNVSLELDSADQLSDLPPLWALPDLLPCHRLSLVAAPSGTGLTQFACHLAATLAATPMLPAPAEEQEPASPEVSLHEDTVPSVLLITHHDGPDVLKPRLQALGADLRRILILSHVYHHHPGDRDTSPYQSVHPFTCTDHAALSEVLHEHRGIRLVLIDHAEQLFSSTNHPSRSQIQRQLELLQAVADRREVAIVLLASTPSLSLHPFRSTILSTLRDSCRLVYLLAPDQQDPQARLLFCLKNTLTSLTSTRRLYPALPAGRAHPQLSCSTALAQYQAEVSCLSYPQYLQLLAHPQTRGPAPHQHDYACEVLIETLKHGPMRVGNKADPDPATLYQQSQAAGVAWSTFQRAKQTLQVTSYKQGEHWYWQLPESIPTSPEALPSLCSSTKYQGPSTTLRSSPDLAACAQAVGLSSALPAGYIPEETCASSPANSAQLLTPPAPPTPGGIATENLSIFPEPTPEPVVIQPPPPDPATGAPA